MTQLEALARNPAVPTEEIRARVERMLTGPTNPADWWLMTEIVKATETRNG